MAVRTLEELQADIKAVIGDNSSDEVLSLLENVTDTFTDRGTNWKEKYEENDREWRERYKERFMGKKPEIEEDFEAEDEPVKKAYTYDALFKEG